MEETVPCTVELPEGTRFDDAFALVEDGWADWLAEEGRVDLTFGTADGRAWEIKGVDVAIQIDG